MKYFLALVLFFVAPSLSQAYDYSKYEILETPTHVIVKRFWVHGPQTLKFTKMKAGKVATEKYLIKSGIIGPEWVEINKIHEKALGTPEGKILDYLNSVPN